MINFPFFVQAAGFAAYVLSLAGMLRKEDKSYLNYTIIGMALWVSHFVMLGALTGAFSDGIAFLRSLAARFIKGRRWRYMCVFVLLNLYVLAGFMLYQKWPDLLPLAGSFIATCGVLLLHGVLMRWSLAISSAFWLAYTLYVHSWPGVLQEITLVTACLITICRLHRNPLDQKPLTDEKAAGLVQ